jgi:hypothetical protein
MDFIHYFFQNASNIAEAALALHAAALLIVNLTPTPRDDKAVSDLGKFVAKAYKAIEFAAGIITPKVKM